MAWPLHLQPPGAPIHIPAAVFYDAVGPDLTCWHTDIGNAALTRQGSVTLPALIQYVWGHPTKPVLYVASSNFVPLGNPDGKHHLTAFRIDPATGALSPFGAPVAIRARPINITVDAGGKWLLTAYNIPSTMSVHPLGRTARSARRSSRQRSIDGGIYAHQIRMMPSNRALVLVTRGNNATAAKAEDPGALKVKGLKNGQLTDIDSIAPGSGYGFGPRHVDIHPTKPWMFVSVERQNQLQMYRMRGDDLEPAPAFVVTTLNEPGNLRPEQMVGPIHIHPNGRFVYIGNRASGQIESARQEGRRWRREQHRGIRDRPDQRRTPAGAGDRHARVSSAHVLDRPQRSHAGGRQPAGVAGARRRQRQRSQPATLSAYKIGADGKLTFVRSYDIEAKNLTQWWSGFIGL